MCPALEKSTVLFDVSSPLKQLFPLINTSMLTVYTRRIDNHNALLLPRKFNNITIDPGNSRNDNNTRDGNNVG